MKEKSIISLLQKCIYAHNNLMSQDIKKTPILYLNKHGAVQLKVTEITYFFPLCVQPDISKY